MINMFGRKYKAIIKRIQFVESENSRLKNRVWQLENPHLEIGAKVFYCDGYNWKVGVVGDYNLTSCNYYEFIWNYNIIIDGKKIFTTSLVEKYDAKSIRLKK